MPEAICTARAKFSASDEFSEGSGQTYPLREVTKEVFRFVKAANALRNTANNLSFKLLSTAGLLLSERTEMSSQFSAICYKSDYPKDKC